MNLVDLLQIAGAGMLGLLVGALLAEGALLIPYWQTLPAKQFHALHPTFGPRLFRFFAPLTIAAPMLMAAAAVAALWSNDARAVLSVVAACLTAGLVVIYFLFFKAANIRIALPGKTDEELAQELVQWSTWHWSRVVVGLTAFALSLFAL